MSFNENLKRIQNLSLAKRKIIFWSVIIVLGLIFFAFWIINIKQKIKFFSKENVLKEMKLPELKQRMETLPKLENPKGAIENELNGLKEIQEKTK